MPKFFEEINEDYIKSNFSGLMVIPDVHGIINSYKKATDYAEQNNLYIVSLGDLIDYGPNSKEVIELTKSLHDNKKISVVLGNHERKFFKWIVQNQEGHVRIKLKPAIQASIDSFGGDKKATDDFVTLHSDMVNILKYKNNYFTHGALHHNLLEKMEYSPVAYQMAIFAEIDNTLPKREDGYPNRIYNWVSKLPNDIRVFVGHDIRSRENPVADGPVVFLDTGCGKEGFLSAAILNIDGTLKEFGRF